MNALINLHNLIVFIFNEFINKHDDDWFNVLNDLMSFLIANMIDDTVQSDMFFFKEFINLNKCNLKNVVWKV